MYMYTTCTIIYTLYNNNNIIIIIYTLYTYTESYTRTVTVSLPFVPPGLSAVWREAREAHAPRPWSVFLAILCHISRFRF